MTEDQRLELRRAQAALRATALACERRHEHAKARKIRRVQVALNRAWRPGTDVNKWLEATRALVVSGQ